MSFCVFEVAVLVFVVAVVVVVVVVVEETEDGPEGFSFLQDPLSSTFSFRTDRSSCLWDVLYFENCYICLLRNKYDAKNVT
jgi:hypothetical protein